MFVRLLHTCVSWVQRYHQDVLESSAFAAGALETQSVPDENQVVSACGSVLGPAGLKLTCPTVARMVL